MLRTQCGRVALGLVLPSSRVAKSTPTYVGEATGEGMGSSREDFSVASGASPWMSQDDE
jgi:hypothetical protein